MMTRVARAAAIGVMVLILMVTPLSSVLSGGQLETWLPGSGFGNPFVHVTLYDQTGMVRAISPGSGRELDGVSNPGGNTYLLEASWLGGCGDRDAQLTLQRSPTGYALWERTDAWSCSFMIGIGRSVAIYLWSPIDAATVTFQPLD